MYTFQRCIPTPLDPQKWGWSLLNINVHMTHVKSYQILPVQTQVHRQFWHKCEHTNVHTAQPAQVQMSFGKSKNLVMGLILCFAT